MFGVYFQLFLSRGDGMQVENHLHRVNNGISVIWNIANNTIYLYKHSEHTRGVLLLLLEGIRSCIINLHFKCSTAQELFIIAR